MKPRREKSKRPGHAAHAGRDAETSGAGDRMSVMIEPAQRTAARIVGGTYIFVNVTAIFAMGYVRGSFMGWNDVAAAAAHIKAAETLFRTGIAFEIITSCGDIVLAAAFYVLLSRVNRNIALAGSFFRVANATVLALATLTSFIVLRILSGAAYLRAFDSGQLHALARLFFGAHDGLYVIGFTFLFIGSTLTSYLLYKSRYIPRALGLWGTAASVLALAANLGALLFPSVDVVIPLIFVPLGLFELVTGFWLLIKGLPDEPAVYG